MYSRVLESLAKGGVDLGEMPKYTKYLGRSPAILTSDDFVRSNEIIRTKWPIY